MRRIAVLDAPSNLGLRPPTATSVPGCAKAPGALRDQGLLTRLAARDAGCLTPPRYDPGDWRPGDGVAHAAEIAAYSRALADRIGAIIDGGEFPVVLGGDCSILIGSGIAMHRLGDAVGGRIGLVFVDGHSDFRHPGNASYVGAAAGEDLALVTGRGQANLAAIESRRPYFRDIDVVVLGIRAQDEYRLDLQAAGIVTRPVPALRAEGAARSAQWARDQLVDCAGYWVHVDVDVLDPAVMPAVDAPDPGGIAFPELELLLAGLVESPHCLGVEITVFDPDYDPDGRYAAEITSAVVSGLSPVRSTSPRPDLAAARRDLAATAAPDVSPDPPSQAEATGDAPSGTATVGAPHDGSAGKPTPAGATPDRAVSGVGEAPDRAGSGVGGTSDRAASGSGGTSDRAGSGGGETPDRAEPDVAEPVDPGVGVPLGAIPVQVGPASAGDAATEDDRGGSASARPVRNTLPVDAESVLAAALGTTARSGNGRRAAGVGDDARTAHDRFGSAPATTGPTGGTVVSDEPGDSPGVDTEPDRSGLDGSGHTDGDHADRDRADLDNADLDNADLDNADPGDADPGNADPAEVDPDKAEPDETEPEAAAEAEPADEEPVPVPDGPDSRAGANEVRLLSRPLGSAPLLDSDPIPATRPGMLRPRPPADPPVLGDFGPPAAGPGPLGGLPPGAA
ncbi:arginase family protein [Actinoplanes flavus]|uniref:Arginase family protein n=1 Tax=Actinoplanes flavus TaxID=2820290 RepID=A0ABS3UC27_9ACTN|nr:arginase family protein [Actinoplanes flavus]